MQKQGILFHVLRFFKSLRCFFLQKLRKLYKVLSRKYLIRIPLKDSATSRDISSIAQKLHEDMFMELKHSGFLKIYVSVNKLIEELKKNQTHTPSNSSRNSVFRRRLASCSPSRLSHSNESISSVNKNIKVTFTHILSSLGHIAWK